MIFLFSFIVFLSTLGAQEQGIEFGKAIELYLNGQYDQSIVIAEEILKKEPQNKKAQDLLFKASKKYSAQLEKEKKYPQALERAQRARAIRSDDKEHQDAERRLKELTEVSSRKKRKETAPEKQGPSRSKPASKKETNQDAEVKGKKEGAKTLPQTPPEEKSEKKEEDVLNKEEKKSGKSFYPFLLPFFGVLNFIGILALLYFFMTHSPKREEEKMLIEERRVSQLVDSLTRDEKYDVILGQQKDIMDSLSKIPKSDSSFKEQSQELIKLIERLTKAQDTVKIEMPQGSSREVLTDVSPVPRVRADSVEMISGMFDDPVVVEEMLEPYLRDSNNRVLANAAKALFPYNRRRAIDILKSMVYSNDKWMRMSSAWAFGEAACDETLEVLRPLLNDNERLVRIRAVKAFWRFQELSKKQLPREIELKMQEIIQEENLKRDHHTGP
ncbi:MAG TPA: hypothetical protein VJC03_08755 [bacterium]|nr:hypothetical protein [bacterium]